MKITWYGEDRDEPTDHGDWRASYAVGSAFYDDDYPAHLISAQHAGKRPICIRLPGGVYFCIYSKQITDGVPHEPGWTVTGEPESITLQPSVDIKGVWHGFITNGSFSPDVAQTPTPVPEPQHAAHGDLK